MLEIEHLTKTYGKATKAVERYFVYGKRWGSFGFLGPNGAGKTTTIKMMTGF
jgi:ABC-2 type transport system ATP-binding protein